MVVAAAIGATFWITGGDAFDVFESAPESCAVESEPGSIELAAATSIRQVLSEQPALRWTQVASPIEEFEAPELFSSTASPSDGRVYVLAEAEDRHRLLATADGTDWNEYLLPDGIDPKLIQISDGLWAIAGRAIGDDPDHDDAEGRWELPRVLVSDDRGENWAEVPIDPQTPPLFRDQHLATLDLMVSGQNIALVTLVYSPMQLEDALVDRGLAEASDDAALYGIENGQLIAGLRAPGGGGVYRYVELSLDDLNLTEREHQLVGHLDRVRADYPGYPRIYAGTRAGLELGHELDGDWWDGTVTTSGFVVAVAHQEPPRASFLASADARDWEEIYSVEDSHHARLASIAAGETALAAFGGGAHPRVLLEIGCGQAPEPLAVLELPETNEPNRFWISRRLDLSAGPAGLVADQLMEATEYIDVESTSDDGTPSATQILVHQETERLMLWSPDARTWHVIDIQGAFGADVSPASVQFAIGSDFVIASGWANEQRLWIMAEVP